MTLLFAADTAVREVGTGAAGGGLLVFLITYGPKVLKAMFSKSDGAAAPAPVNPSPVIIQPQQAPAPNPVPSSICLEHAERLAHLEEKAEDTQQRLDKLKDYVCDLPNQVVAAIQKSNEIKH
ncbi:MAG: hypothetical protein ABFE01_04190 [Phycisphaerales bacterium]